jgi:hypothetical protein
LRFDLSRRNEPAEEFEARINALAAQSDEDDDAIVQGDQNDPGRLLGSKSISAGSLHVEEWRCSGVDLALRDRLAIFPVGGWWKATGDKERNNGTMRYSLVVTIDAGDVEQDLWVEISDKIEIHNEILI